jgi:DNA polymerase-3 subunit delta'
VVRDTLAEQYNISLDKASLLSRLSAGRLGWALLAHKDAKIMQERQQTIGTFINLSSANVHQRLAHAAELAAQFTKGRDRVAEILSSWMEWWHDLLLIKGGNGQSITNIDYQATLSSQAESLTMRQISEFVRHLQTATRQLEQNVNARLAFEVLMLRMP